MNHTTKLFVGVVFLLLGLMTIAERAHAQELAAEIMPPQHGSAILVGVTGVGSFTLASSEVVLSGFLRDGSVAPTACVPCTPGSSLGLRSSFGGVITAPLSWGSVSYLTHTLNVYFGGQLIFDADPIQVPTLRSRRDVVITVPATVAGNIAGYLLNPFIGDPGPPLFITPISLQGTATVVLKLMDKSPLNNNRLYTFQSITYDFPPVQNPN